MKYDEDVVGVAFTDVELSESGTEVYFTGIALETGVWTDSHRNTWFYPLNAIHRGSHLFVGAPVLCRHSSGQVGKILEVINTETGMNVRGVITHPDSISAVLSKNLRGLSVGMYMKTDPVKRVLLEITSAKEISLVERPACKVCILDNSMEIKSENSDARSDTMDDEKVEYDEAPEVSLEEQEPEEYPMPNCEEFEDDAEKLEACQEFSKSVSIFKKAQEVWRSIFVKDEDEDMDTQNEETNMTESKTPADKAEIVETTVKVEAEAEVKMEAVKTESEVTEVEVEAEAEVKVEAAAPEVESTEEVVVEAEAEVVEGTTEVEVEAEAEVGDVEEVIVEQSAEVLNLTAELSEVKQLLETSKTELAGTQVQLAEVAAELSITKSQLKTIEDKERTDLVAAVMSADPNADTELIDNMSNVQLEAYQETVTRLSKPKVGSVRKTVNATEKSVEMSSPKTAKDDLIPGVIGYLKERQ